MLQSGTKERLQPPDVCTEKVAGLRLLLLRRGMEKEWMGRLSQRDHSIWNLEAGPSIDPCKNGKAWKAA